jgi:hypothetical protein
MGAVVNLGRRPGPERLSQTGRHGAFLKLVSLLVILALVPGCQGSAAKLYIPLAYALTGVCIALLVSPTATAAIVGFILGGLLGAAVYNNSLKRQLLEHRPPAR